MSTNFQRNTRIFPSHADYDLAVRYMDKFVSDPILKVGVVQPEGKTAVAGGGSPISYPGGFAKVYVVTSGGKKYALRCWLHDIGEAKDRYGKIAAFISAQQTPHPFVGIHYHDEGILVNGNRFPIVRMEWAEGMNISDFITANLHNPKMLEAAANGFLDMVRTLHRASVAHGDMQAENMKLAIEGGAVRIRLIDYDTLVIPALAGAKVSSTGRPGYQHPKRPESDLATEKDDYFSELVIYTTLLALMERPGLWDEFRGDPKDLIFGKDDFEAAEPTEVFWRLYGMRPAVKRLAVALWNFAKSPGIKFLIPLEQMVDIVTGQQASPPAPAAAAPPSMQGKKPGGFDALIKAKLEQAQQATVTTRPQSSGWLDERAFQRSLQPPPLVLPKVPKSFKPGAKAPPKPTTGSSPPPPPTPIPVLNPVQTQPPVPPPKPPTSNPPPPEPDHQGVVWKIIGIIFLIFILYKLFSS